MKRKYEQWYTSGAFVVYTSVIFYDFREKSFTVTSNKITFPGNISINK